MRIRHEDKNSADAGCWTLELKVMPIIQSPDVHCGRCDHWGDYTRVHYDADMGHHNRWSLCHACVLTPQVVTIYQPLSLHMAHKTSDDL